MSAGREAFLQRVRQALRTQGAGGRDQASGGRQPPVSLAPDPRTLPPDPIARFSDELAAAGGTAHVVDDREAAVKTIIELVQMKSAHKVLLGKGEFVDSLNLAASLEALGLQVIAADAVTAETARDLYFAADIGISGVNYCIAETGTVVLGTSSGLPRSVSLLPPVHIAVCEAKQLLGDLFDLFEPDRLRNNGTMPSCVSLITGPSKTGDIELRLVKGVHGPGEIDVIVVRETAG
jgi:L-lactate dehydrogenase complex protein LldG